MNFLHLISFLSTLSSSCAQVHEIIVKEVAKKRIIKTIPNTTITQCLLGCQNESNCQQIGTEDASQALVTCYLLKEDNEHDAHSKDQKMTMQVIQQYVPAETNLTEQGNCTSESGNVAKKDHILRYFRKEENLGQGRLLTTIPKLTKYFMITFEVYPTSYGKFANIINLSNTELEQYGHHIPGVWFRASSASKDKLHISCSVNGNYNHVFLSKKEFPLNNWIKVRIQQTKVNGKAVYAIYLNDEKVHETLNTQPSDFDNVKVYVPYPPHRPQEGRIRNLIIDTQVSAP